MRIYEIEKNTEVILEVKCKGMNSLEWKCPVVETSIKGKCILVPPLKSNDKILSFKNADIIAQITCIIDEIPYVFKGCSVQYIKTKTNSYHAIICNENGVKINRRSHFRVNIDEYCYVNHGKATIDAIIKDISFSGFSFVVSHWDDVKMDFIQLTYHDSITNNDVILTGRVVRTQNLENDKTLIGCYMIPKESVNRYINERQRKTMKKLKEE